MDAVCQTEGRIRDAPGPALRWIGGVVLHGGGYIPFCEKCCAGHLGYDQWRDLPVGQDHELCCPWQTGCWVIVHLHGIEAALMREPFTGARLGMRKIAGQC